jgi:hypothetical protein
MAQLARHRTFRHRGLFFALFSLGAFSLLACTAGGRDAEDRSAEDIQQEAAADELEKSLKVTVEEMLAILRDGGPATFLGLISRDGVTFGIDGPPIALSEMRRQFGVKGGTYCILFDTQCARRENERERARAGVPPPREPIFSYRDLLKRATQRRVRVWVSRDRAGWWGEAIVTLGGDDTETVDSEDGSLNFEFAYEAGAWKLRAVVYH